jgi:uncharacterized membrane protein YkgB
VFVATVIFGALVSMLFMSAGLLKLTNQPQAREGRAKFGISEAGYKRIGALEVLGVAGVLLGLAVPALGVAAGIGLAIVAFGALRFHLRVQDPPAAIAGAVVAGTTAVAYVLLRLATA